MSDDHSGNSEPGGASEASPGPGAADHRNGADNAGDFFAGLVIFLIAMYAAYESINMPFYGDSGVWGSPGLTPGLISAVLMVLSAILMYRARRFAMAHVGLSLSPEAKRGFGTFALILVYVATIPFVGYVPATFVMLFVFQVLYAKTRNLRFLIVWALGLSVLLTAALYYVFAQIFLIPLPKGVLGV
ncbi:MAG: tripartite tricarboxylate transporter TctB family protein [Pseudomonadota bacterium]